MRCQWATCQGRPVAAIIHERTTHPTVNVNQCQSPESMPKYTPELQQFGLVAGSYQTTSPFILTAEPRNPLAAEARKGRLYMLTEPFEVAGDGQTACQLVTRTIHKVFYAHPSTSITTALRVALVEANRVLYQHNFSAPPPKRAQVGVVCAVLREADLYLAQVAPAQAYVLCQQQVRAFPQPPHWRTAHTSAAPFLSYTPLGHSLFVEPELHRCQMGVGDVLLLCSSNLAPHLACAELVPLLRAGNPQALIEHVITASTSSAVAQSHALAVVLAAPVRAPSPAPVVAVPPPKPKPPRKRGTPAPPPDLPAQREPLPEVPVLELGASLPEQVAAHANERLLSPSLWLGETDFGAVRVQGEPIDLGDPYLRTVTVQPYQPRRVRRPLSDMPLAERLVYPFHLLGDEIEDRFVRPLRSRSRASANKSRRPERPSRPPRHEDDVPPARPILSTLMGVTILAAFVLLLFLYGTAVARRAATEDTAGYLAVAEERMAAVQQAASLEEATRNLASVQQAMLELRANPLITDTNAAFWLRYMALQKDLEVAEASVLRQTYLDPVEVLATHPTPGRAFTRLVVPPAVASVTDPVALEAVQSIYALDGNRETAQLYRIPRSGGIPEVVLGPGQLVQETVAGPLQAIAWRLDNVVAIDQSAGGYGYFFINRGEWNYTRLGGSEIWLAESAPVLRTYEGNLYVWGAEPNEILRYNSGRYGDFPDLWLGRDGSAGRDIGTAIDMVIDGGIALLQPDGRIFIFARGAFQRELPTPQVQPPVALVTRFTTLGNPETGAFFILDTLNERIIHIDKASGEVLQQMRVRDSSPIRLNQLLDLHVVEEGGRLMLYLINGDQILRAGVPPVPRPFSPPNQAGARP